MKPTIDEALQASDKKLAALKDIKKSGDMPRDQIAVIQDELYAKRKRLKSMQDEFVLADLELKTLISLHPEKQVKLILADDFYKKDYLPRLDNKMSKNITQALQKRPEVREELLNLKISQRELNTKIYETFPGLNLLVTGNYDNNSFLQDNEWLGLTASISQSVTRLLTLPKRYQRAEEEIDLANARRKALVAAVISQTHIAQRLLDRNYANYDEQLSYFEVSKDKYDRFKHMKNTGLKSGFDEAIARLDYEIAKVELYQSYTMAQSSFARMMNTIGYDVDNLEGISDLAQSHKTDKLG